MWSLIKKGNRGGSPAKESKSTSITGFLREFTSNWRSAALLILEKEEVTEPDDFLINKTKEKVVIV